MRRLMQVLVRSVAAVAMLAALVVVPARGTAAQIEGDCTATLAGQDVETATSPASAIEVDHDEVVRLQGTDPSGAPFTRIELRFPPVPAITVYDEPNDDPADPDWGGEVQISDYAVWGVGLYQISGRTDDCTGTAWVKVTGRSPFTTVAGGLGTAIVVVGAGASVVGLARARATSWRGFFRSVGTGAVLGVGAAVLAQQFGVTPLTGAAVAGWVGAAGSTVGLANLGVSALRGGSAAAAA